MTVFTHFENVWQEGAPLVQSAMAQSFMHGSTVFDGARAFNGCVPDLDRHFSRLIRSAQFMGIKSPLGVQEITDLAIEGVKNFPAKAELYIRPSLFAEGGFLVPDADDVRFVMTVFDVPMPEPSGFGACLTNFRRPNPNMAPTEAKAACLYPNSSLAIKEANRRGFENAVMRDGADNVVEFASSNLWFAKDGEVVTPSPNRTFLNGVTRQRVMSLLIENGLDVREREVKFEDVIGADEVFSSGNLGKVLPVTRVEECHFPVGPICL